jgi:hypothetical protein
MPTTREGLRDKILGIWKENKLIGDNNVPIGDGRWGASDVKAMADIAAVNYRTLTGKQAQLYWEYVTSLGKSTIGRPTKLKPALLLDLLGDMMPRVPFNNVEDIRNAGFYSETADKGDTTALWQIKVVSGFLQMGMDTKEFFNGSDPFGTIISADVLNAKLQEEWKKMRVEEKTQREDKYGWTNEEYDIVHKLETAMRDGNEEGLKMARNAILKQYGIDTGEWEELSHRIMSEGSLLNMNTMRQELRREGAEKFLYKVRNRIDALKRGEEGKQITKHHRQERQPRKKTREELLREKQESEKRQRQQHDEFMRTRRPFG